MSIRVGLLPLISLLLSACAQVQVVLPNPRVEIPETRGEQNRWRLSVGGGDAHAYRATGNGGERPPDLSKPTVRGYLDMHPGATWSPWSPLEIGAEVNVFGSGFGALAKWQILGEGTSSAKKGNFPVSIFARAGTAYGSKNGDQTSFGGDGGYDWRGEINARYTQAGLSLGYRAGAHALLYGGVAFAEYWTKTKLSQDAVAADPVGGSYEAGQPGDGKSASVGVMFNWRKVQFWFSGAFTRIDYGPTDDMESIFLNTGVQFTP